jgi:TrmH family RNA methyltransferase
MITLKKFLSLNGGTQKRKLMRLIGDFEQALSDGESRQIDGFRRFFQGLHVALSRGEADASLVDPGELAKLISASYSIHAAFAANRLRHILMDELGKVAADWDRGGGARSGLGESGDPQRVMLTLGDPARLPLLRTGEKGLYLDDIRSPYNVGAIFRSAEFFGLRYIVMSPQTPLPGTTRLDRTSMGASSRISWAVAGREDFVASIGDSGEWCAALETGGTDIGSAPMPVSGWMVLGNEELGVHPDILAFLSGEGRPGPSLLTISGGGDKASLNVSVACGIALSRWFAAGG